MESNWLFTAMSSKILVSPARSVKQRICHATRPMALSLAFTFLSKHLQLQQQRNYAKRRLVPLRRAKPSYSIPNAVGNAASNPSGNPNLLFGESWIPPLSFWEEYASAQPLPPDLTAQLLYDAAKHYCNLATNLNSAWKGELQRVHDIDPYTLHHAGIALLPMMQINESAKLGFHMLRTASSMGYAPSTISLIRMITQLSPEAYAKQRPLIGPVEAHLKQILIRNPLDSDALTVQGLLYLRDGDKTRALTVFDSALSVSGMAGGERVVRAPLSSNADPKSEDDVVYRAPRFTYEGVCHIKRGTILLSLGRRDEALAAFNIAALELGLADGYTEVAKLLPRSDPQRKTYLLKAAQADNWEAVELLMRDELEVAVDESRDVGERMDATSWAMEWASMQPSKEKSRQFQKEVMDLIKVSFDKAST